MIILIEHFPNPLVKLNLDREHEPLGIIQHNADTGQRKIMQDHEGSWFLDKY